MMEEKDGIQAVIFLQGVVDIVETEESAKAIWDGFNTSQKEQTETAYNIFNTEE